MQEVFQANTITSLSTTSSNQDPLKRGFTKQVWKSDGFLYFTNFLPHYQVIKSASAQRGRKNKRDHMKESRYERSFNAPKLICTNQYLRHKHKNSPLEILGNFLCPLQKKLQQHLTKIFLRQQQINQCVPITERKSLQVKFCKMP